jgi:hypothetical protein
MIRRALAIALVVGLVLQPGAAMAHDWLDDVPAAVGLYGCTRDGPSVTGWHCTGYRAPTAAATPRIRAANRPKRAVYR